MAALLNDLEGELWEAADHWVSPTADSRGREELRAAVGEVVSVWVEHGPVLRAIVESALGNPTIHALWREELLERFIDGVTGGIEALGTHGTGAAPANSPPLCC